MLSGRQISAARGLLGLDASEFAQKVGLTRESIFNIEHNIFRPRASTIKRIMDFLDASNIELIGERGVALRQDMITMYEGEGYYVKFLNEVYRFSSNNKTEVLFLNVDDSLSTDEIIKLNQRMQKEGIRCRYICKENPGVLAFKKEYYRAIPDAYFRNGLQVIYGDYLGTSVHGTMMLVLRNEAIAQGMRNLFNLIWEISKMPEIPNA